MTTLRSVLTRHDREVLGHLDREAQVPVVAFGRQGDVVVVADSVTGWASTQPDAPVPPEGIPVVRGETGGNTHLLVADGGARFAWADEGTARWADLGPFDPELLDVGTDRRRIGTLAVDPGAVAYLIHEEHGAIGFAPGRYAVLRQREFDGFGVYDVLD